MKPYQHPPLAAVPLVTLMQALSDPGRLEIVRQLLAAGEGAELTCGQFSLDICKATRSHHFQVLREAGVVRMRGDGNKCRTSLRRAEIDARFPGLLAMVGAEPSPAASHPAPVPPPPAAPPVAAVYDGVTSGT